MVEYPIDQKVFNSTYTSIQIYRRFIDWKASDVFSFKVNGIYVIKKRILLYSESTPLVGGSRIYIFSNKASLYKDEKGIPNPNIYFLPEDSYFKLIGRSDFQGKNSLFFLNIPKDGYTEFYKDTSIMDTLLINYATREFEVECALPDDKKPLPEPYAHSVCPGFTYLPDPSENRE